MKLLIFLITAAIAIAADAVDANPGYEWLQSTGYFVKWVIILAFCAFFCRAG